MKYLELTLSGFKRFALSNITYFNYKPTEPLQIILGSNGSGKAQPLNAKIKVPSGWSTMGEMKIGTEVIAKDGTITKVNGVFPQGQKEIFKIIFEDGRSTECCADHLWKVYVGGRIYPIKPRIINTTELIRLKNNKSISHLLWIDLPDSENNKDKDLPIDPYLLGVFLGDGSGRSLTPTITSPDDFIGEELKKILPTDCELSTSDLIRNNCKTYRVIKKDGIKGRNPFTHYLIENGLFNKLSYDKFIPEEYLNASSKQRLHLLQGLLDTDGTIGKLGTISFCSSSEKLSLGVQYLVRSLGGLAKISKRFPFYTYLGQKLNGRTAYQVNIRYKKQSELFRLPKKKDRTNDNNQYAKILKLRIKSIETLGNKEAQCISVDHPEHLYITDDFIVTHNTSLVSELTPLPANASDFEKDGFKEIVILHKNNTYKLKSTFNPTTRHSFIKNDGENLNNGGTASVQKELILQEFGISNEIHELITGIKVFHQMGPGVRREWFTKLSETSYEYAIGLYNKLKERHRDTNGALKLARKRLVSETIKIVSTKEREALEKEAEELHSFLQHLNDFRKPLEHNLENLKKEEQTLITSAHQLSKLLLKKKLKIDKIDFENTEQIKTEINKLKNGLEVDKQLLNRFHEEFDELNKTLEIAKGVGIQNSAEIEASIKQLDEKQNSLRSRRNILTSAIDNAQDVLHAFETIQPAIEALLLELPENSDRKYTNKTQEENAIRLANLRVELDKHEDYIKTLKLTREHQELHKSSESTQCPKCKHQWNIGFNELIYNECKTKIDEHTLLLEKVKEELAKAEEFSNAVNSYLSSYRALFNYFKNWPILKPLFDHLVDKKIILEKPSSVIKENNLFLIDIKAEIECNKLQAQIQTLEQQLLLREQLGNQDIEKLIARQTVLESGIQKHTVNISNYQTSINKLESFLSEILTIERLNNEIKNYLSKATDCNNNTVETMRRMGLQKAIRDVQTTLARKEDVLSEIRLQKGIIDDLENQIKQLEIDEVALKLLVKELSPTEGLIAEGLMGFMKLFIAQMNSFIKKVWTYPLTIVPCQFTEEGRVDLDYKFPVIVQSTKSVIPDISDCSTGQREVINLAFRITAMKYLGLSDSALTLDEFASAMDTAHKEASVGLIKSFITEANYTQVFLISHDYSQYGALNNTEVCVLNKDNIVVPNSYNTHVTMQ